jgi:ABC-type Mn2+/Zn2+ transport system permease subunit
VAYLISVAMSFLSAYDLPTVGASGFAYALIGSFAKALYDKKISFQKQLHLLVFHSGVTLGILITLIHPGSNGMLHLLSYLCGFFLLKVRSGSSVWR